MRSDNMTTGRVRIVIALAVVSALTLMAGLLLAIVGLVLRTGKHPQHGLIMFGLDVAVAGLAFGAGLLLIFVLLRGGFTTAGARDAPGSRPSGAPRPAAPQRAAAAAGGGPRFAPAANRGTGPYATSPAQPASAWARTAGPTGAYPQVTVPHGTAPHLQATGLQPHATGPQPRVTAPQAHATGPQPHATGPQPHATGPQPRVAPQPPATGPANKLGRDVPAAGSGPAGPRPVPDPRLSHGQAGAHLDGAPPRSSPRPSEPVRVAPRKGDPGPGRVAPRHPEGGRGATRPRPAGSAPDPVFVYRDTNDDASVPTLPPTGADMPSRPTADQGAAYWYGRDEDPGKASAEPVRGPFEPVRGPFEPLRHSAEGIDQASEPGGRAAGSAGRPDPAGPVTRAGQEPRQAAQAQAQVSPPVPARPEGAGPDRVVPDERADQHTRKLEQIKDLYLTAETIGEANVARHFDQFLAQQRELIGDYIKQSKAALHDDTQAVDPTAT